MREYHSWPYLFSPICQVSRATCDCYKHRIRHEFLQLESEKFFLLLPLPSVLNILPFPPIRAYDGRYDISHNEESMHISVGMMNNMFFIIFVSVLVFPKLLKHVTIE